MYRILLLSCLLSSSFLVNSQVVINEVVLLQSYVELKNLSDTSVDVSQYYLSSGTVSSRVGQNFPLCGDFDLAPGEILMIQPFQNLHFSDGEVLLSDSDDVFNFEAAIDYLQWGSRGHFLEAVADSADIWTSGDFIEAVLNGGSFEYDGDGDSSTDWSAAAVPSECEENGTGCIVEIGDVTPEDNYIACIGDGSPDPFPFSWTGGGFETFVPIILNGNNEIVGFAINEIYIDMDSVSAEDTSGMHVLLLGHNGPIGNLEIGGQFEDLIGCYDYSESYPVTALLVEEGDLQAIYNDSLYTTTIDLCTSDGDPDLVQMENTSSHGEIAFVIFNESNNSVIDIVLDNLPYNFEGISVPTLLVRSFAYVGSINGEIGQHESFVYGNECWINAPNLLLINTDECISATSSVNDISSLFLSPNPVSDLLTISNLPAGPSEIKIYNVMGTRILTHPVYIEDGVTHIQTNGLLPGTYLINIENGGKGINKLFSKLP